MPASYPPALTVPATILAAQNRPAGPGEPGPAVRTLVARSHAAGRVSAVGQRYNFFSVPQLFDVVPTGGGFTARKWPGWAGNVAPPDVML